MVFSHFALGAATAALALLATPAAADAMAPAMAPAIAAAALAADSPLPVCFGNSIIGIALEGSAAVCPEYLTAISEVRPLSMLCVLCVL